MSESSAVCLPRSLASELYDALRGEGLVDEGQRASWLEAAAAGVSRYRLDTAYGPLCLRVESSQTQQLRAWVEEPAELSEDRAAQRALLRCNARLAVYRSLPAAAAVRRRFGRA